MILLEPTPSPWQHAKAGPGSGSLGGGPPRAGTMTAYRRRLAARLRT